MVTDRTQDTCVGYDRDEKLRAWYAALAALSEEYPPANQRQKIDRADMFSYIRLGDFTNSRWCAQWSGIPIERIEAIEALLF